MEENESSKNTFSDSLTQSSCSTLKYTVKSETGRSEVHFSDGLSEWEGMHSPESGIQTQYYSVEAVFVIFVKKLTLENIMKIKAEYERVVENRPGWQVSIGILPNLDLTMCIKLYTVFASQVTKLGLSNEFSTGFFNSVLKYKKLAHLELDQDIYLHLRDELKLLKALKNLESLKKYVTSKFFAGSSKYILDPFRKSFDFIVKNTFVLPFIPFENTGFVGKRFVIRSPLFEEAFYRRVLITTLMRDKNITRDSFDDKKLFEHPLCSIISRDRKIFPKSPVDVRKSTKLSNVSFFG